MQFRYVLALTTALIFPQTLRADDPVSISLEPLAHSDASLTVVALDGTASVYSAQELENFSTYRVVTTTPWRTQPARFDGVMLSDILGANGLADVASIRVIAENDYAVSLPRELWANVPVMVATRADDQTISRRNRGPIQFVIHADEFAGSDVPHERHLVWMAARIEAE